MTRAANTVPAPPDLVAEVRRALQVTATKPLDPALADDPDLRAAGWAVLVADQRFRRETRRPGGTPAPQGRAA